MEDLVTNILQIIQGGASEELNQYFIEVSSAPDLGPNIMQILSSEEEFTTNINFIHSIIGLLKTWFLQYRSELDEETKTGLFGSLHLLLKKDYPKELSLAESQKLEMTSIYASALALFIKKDAMYYAFYEEFLYEYLEKINSCCVEGSISMASTYAYLANAILLKISSNGFQNSGVDPSVLNSRIISSFTPIFEEDSFKTTKEGLSLLKNCLKCLFYLIKITKGISIQEPIELCYSFIVAMIGHFNQGEITEESISSFIAFCFKISLKIIDFEELSSCRENFYGIAVQTLSFSLENYKNNSYLISYILLCILELKEFLEENGELFSLFISAAEMSEADITEATENPNIFLEKAYSKSHFENCETLIPATNLVNFMCMNSAELSNALFDLPLSETSARVLGFCSSTLIKKYQLGEKLLEWTSMAIGELTGQDEKLTASVLYLVSSIVKICNEETRQQFMAIAVQSLDPEKIVASAIACQLIGILSTLEVPPPEECIEPIIQLILIIPTNHPFTALRKISQNYPDLVQPHAAAILEELLGQLQEGLEKYNEDDEYFDELKKQLDLLGSMIAASGASLVCEPVIEFLKAAFMQTDGEIFGEIAFICTQITKSESPEAINIVAIILDAAEANETVMGFISDFCIPIKQFIVSHTAEFVESQLTERIASIMLQAIDDDLESAQNIGDAVAWSLYVDTGFDVSSIVEFVNQSIEAEKDSRALHIVIAKIIAVLLVTRDMEMNEQYISEMVQAIQFKHLKECDVHLLSFALLKLAAAEILPNDIVPIVASANSSSIEEEEEEEFMDSDFEDDDEITYVINSPYEDVDIKELQMAAISKCSQEVIGLIGEKFPDFLSQ